MRSRKAKKTVKGMTLIECIIALLVVGIAGMIMVVTGTVANRFLLNANHMNNKTEAEAAVGANRNITRLNDCAVEAATEVTTEDITITVGGYGDVSAIRYSTGAASAASSKNVDTNLADDASLEFYVIN